MVVQAATGLNSFAQRLFSPEHPQCIALGNTGWCQEEYRPTTKAGTIDIPHGLSMQAQSPANSLATVWKAQTKLYILLTTTL